MSDRLVPFARGFARPARWAARAAVDLTFPPGCHECGGPMAPGAASGFCLACLASLIEAGRDVCETCAATVGPNLPTDDCVECRGRRWAFERVLACGPYRGRLRERTIAAKARRGTGEGRRLGRLWAALYGDAADVDAVLSVPSDRWSGLLRPHHAADVVAESLAGRLGRPWLPGVLRKVRRTAKQAELSATDRKANLRGAFACGASLEGARILLVDDVTTTLTTANEASKAVMAAGAESVTVACVCRTTRG